MIFAWHHAEEKPPDWEVPTIGVIGHPDWTPPRCVDIDVAVHVQEMAENNFDPAHFEVVHGTPAPPPSESEYAENGRFVRVTSKMQRETPMGTFDTRLDPRHLRPRSLDGRLRRAAGRRDDALRFRPRRSMRRIRRCVGCSP